MTIRPFFVLGLLLPALSAARAGDAVGQKISPWQPGTLDIHQISTGRGNE